LHVLSENNSLLLFDVSVFDVVNLEVFFLKITNLVEIVAGLSRKSIIVKPPVTFAQHKSDYNVHKAYQNKNELCDSPVVGDFEQEYQKNHG